MNKQQVIEALRALQQEVDETMPTALLREQLRLAKADDEEDQGPSMVTGITKMSKAELKIHCKTFGIALTGSELKDTITAKIYHAHWQTDGTHNDLLGFGVHKLRRYSTVYLQYPEYVAWVLGTDEEEKEASPALRRFARYIRAQKAAAKATAPMKAPLKQEPGKVPKSEVKSEYTFIGTPRSEKGGQPSTATSSTSVNPHRDQDSRIDRLESSLTGITALLQQLTEKVPVPDNMDDQHRTKRATPN